MKRSNKVKRFYHCSPNRLLTGTIIKPGGILGKKNYEYRLGYRFEVFITDKPYIHSTITDLVRKGKMFMYEVKPIGKVKKGGYGNEYVCFEAEIVKFIGNISEMGKGLGKHFVEGKRYSILGLRKKKLKYIETLNKIKNQTTQ